MLRSIAVPVLLTFGLACGGSGKPPAQAAAAAPPDPPGVLRLREAYKVFAASAGSGDDFDVLRDAAQVEREGLPARGQAEADLVVAVAAGRLLAANLDRLADPGDPAHDLVATTVLPVAFGESPRDGESVGAFRDRLCEGPAQAACADVLPDFWGAAMAYAAAPRLGSRTGELATSCACGPRYATERDALRIAAEAAAGKDAAERPTWTLENDTLARSAFASPDRPPGDVRVRAELLDNPALARVGSEELARGKTAKERKTLEAKLAGLREATGQPGPDAAWVLVVEATGGQGVEGLLLLAQHAARAGFTALDLEVRVAAPPHHRGWLRLQLVDAARAPRGFTAVRGAQVKRDTLQAFVDKLDAAFATADGVKVAWLLR